MSVSSQSDAHLSSQETMDLFQRYVVPNYGRFAVNLVRGEGSWVWDSEGKRYLDLFPGWGCNLLGHCPPRVVAAVQDQVAKLIHVPNTWYMEPQGRWAQMLSERSFGGQAFFCNSGAEANEAAIKLARLHTPAERYKIVTFTGGFHGRTWGALSATAQPKYHEGIGPVAAGFVYAPYNDLAATETLLDPQCCAFLVEPVQGEGGVKIPDLEFLRGLRELADRHEMLLMFDEVQTGCGRTGHWFAYQHFGIQPDVMTLAKAVCGGVAGGAMLTTPDIAPSLRPGMHAATFGGNPLAARAGIATLETIEEEGLLEHAQQVSQQFSQRLQTLAEELDLIRETRVLGLMIGIELNVEGAEIVKACMDRGLLINCTQTTVLRMLPAMNISAEEVDQGCDILADVLREVNQ